MVGVIHMAHRRLTFSLAIADALLLLAFTSPSKSRESLARDNPSRNQNHYGELATISTIHPEGLKALFGGVPSWRATPTDTSLEVGPTISITHSATNDHVLLNKLKLDANTIYLFDKGYNDYKAFKKFKESGTGFVTRIKDNAAYTDVKKLEIEEHIHSGVKDDSIIEVTVKDAKDISKLELRKIIFYDRVLKREFEFLTNLFGMRADLIAAIYKLRWQIELLFKQLKQNFPLKYFLGDNENAIKIQI